MLIDFWKIGKVLKITKIGKFNFGCQKRVKKFLIIFIDSTFKGAKELLNIAK
jgi:hypothetical protein